MNPKSVEAEIDNMPVALAGRMNLRISNLRIKSDAKL